MLHIYFGKDMVAVREAAFSFVSKAEARGASVTYIDAETFSDDILSHAAGATSLFGGEELFVLDTPSANAEFATAVHGYLQELADSANTFVVIEEGLLAAPKKKYQKYAAVFEEYAGGASERFNVFQVADALARRDKRTLWVLLQEAQQEGLSAEEIIGTLWWQLKSLRLASLTNSAAEAGMKDFPYNKAKRSLIKFTEDELVTISRNLLTVYHEGHLGKQDINLALEKWTLSI